LLQAHKAAFFFKLERELEKVSRSIVTRQLSQVTRFDSLSSGPHSARLLDCRHLFRAAGRWC
jgi:hypothetical protein